MLLHRAGGLPDTSLLLDGTPAAAAAWDGDLQSALPVGSPVAISGGDFTVVVQSVTAAGAVLTVTPAAHVAAAAPAPQPATTVPGGVLPGAADAPQGSAPQTGNAAGFWAPPVDASQALHAAPVLEAAADSSTGTGWLVPLAGAALAAAALFVVRTTRRSWARRA